MDSGDTRSEDSPRYNLLNLHCRMPYFAASKREALGKVRWAGEMGEVIGDNRREFSYTCSSRLISMIACLSY